MGKKAIRISDDAVAAATGRTWDAWESFLDEFKAATLSHKEIVAVVRDAGGLESRWWQQAVANGYEKLKDRRTVGETQDGDFQIGVQRTLPLPCERAWRLLTSPEATRAWLGDGARLSFEEGETYHLSDGATGEIRVVRPRSRVRLTWKPESWRRATTIQVRTVAKGEKTVVSFHQEHLPDPAEREKRRAFFRAALDKLEALARE